MSPLTKRDMRGIRRADVANPAISARTSADVLRIVFRKLRGFPLHRRHPPRSALMSRVGDISPEMSQMSEDVGLCRRMSRLRSTSADISIAGGRPGSSRILDDSRECVCRGP
jgi:hypothetical protein